MHNFDGLDGTGDVDGSRHFTWRRSEKGNLWARLRDNRTVCVFRRERDEMFAYSVANEDGPRYSREVYESEAEAVGALLAALKEGEDEGEVLP